MHAVRGIDISIAPGETVALLGPNGAGNQRPSTCFSGCCRPTPARSPCSVSRQPTSIELGAIGAMLQTGSIIRDLSPRTRDHDGVALSRPDASRRGYRPHRHRRHSPPSHPEAVRRTDPARSFRRRARVQPGLARPRRTHGGDGRRGSACVLDDDARFAGRGNTVVFATHYLEEADAYADRIVLMAHGQIVADGSATEIKATVGARSIRATLPDADLDVLAALPGSRRPTSAAIHRPHVRRFRPSPFGRCWRNSQPPATSRSAAPVWSRRFSR